ncbi:MAG: hypothetical protein V4479_08955 [Actinomycetota bacterium]
MVRIALIVGVIAVVFVIYAFVNCLVTLIPIFGGILWLALGRDRSRGISGAPDDNPEFLRTIGADKAADARIRDLEARLAELDDDDDSKK